MKRSSHVTAPLLTSAAIALLAAPHSLKGQQVLTTNDRTSRKEIKLEPTIQMSTVFLADDSTTKTTHNGFGSTFKEWAPSILLATGVGATLFLGAGE